MTDRTSNLRRSKRLRIDDAEAADLEPIPKPKEDRSKRPRTKSKTPGLRSSSTPKDAVQPPPPEEPVQPPKDLDVKGTASSGFGILYQGRLQGLPTSFQTKLLAFAVSRDPSIASIMEKEFFADLAREKARVVTFDHHVQRVSYLLNEKYSRIPSSLQADLAPDVCNEIGEICDKIAQKVTHQSSFDTKKNAADALTKILECVCKAPDTLGKEVRRLRPSIGTEEWDWRLHDVVSKMMDLFLHSDLARFVGKPGHGGEWYERFCALRELSNKLGIFQGGFAAVEALVTPFYRRISLSDM